MVGYQRDEAFVFPEVMNAGMSETMTRKEIDLFTYRGVGLISVHKGCVFGSVSRIEWSWLLVEVAYWSAEAGLCPSKSEYVGMGCLWAFT